MKTEKKAIVVMLTASLFLIANIIGITFLIPQLTNNTVAAKEEDSEAVEEDFVENKDTTERVAGVSTSSKEATEIGAEILARGGNAVDAAIAAAYAVSVSLPHAGGPGGGGGALILKSPFNPSPTFVDFREVSDSTGEQKADKIAVPGFVLGMERMSQNYGSMPLAELIAPSRDLALEGLTVTPELNETLDRWQGSINTSQSRFFKDGVPVEEGDVVVQPEAARTLEMIMDKGATSYYSMLPSHTNLRYDMPIIQERLVVERPAEFRDIQGMKVWSAPAPFSGKTTLDLTEGALKKSIPPLWTADSAEVLEFFELVEENYQLRNKTLKDPLYKDEYKKKEETDDSFWEEESITTTQISVVDSDGMMVSLTFSLGYYFGNGETVGGFFTNSVMNFSNNGVNRIQPYKKVRTYMSPSILQSKDKSSFVAFGTPGGNKIPQILSQFLLSYSTDSNLVNAVEDPRILVEDRRVLMEMSTDPEITDIIEAKKYDLMVRVRPEIFGAVNAVEYTLPGKVFAYADPRRQGWAEVMEVK